MAGVHVLFSVVLLSLAYVAGLFDDHVHDVRQCAPEQVFTGARCQATLDGVVVHMTNSRVDLRVAGRDMSARIGGIERYDDRRAGEAVRVTLYRGEVFRVKGQDIDLDAAESPAKWETTLRTWVTIGLVLAGSAAVAYLVVWWSDRPVRAAA